MFCSDTLDCCSFSLFILITIYVGLLFFSGILSAVYYNKNVLFRKYNEYVIQSKLEGKTDWVKNWGPPQSLEDQLYEASVLRHDVGLTELLLNRGVEGTKVFQAIPRRIFEFAKKNEQRRIANLKEVLRVFVDRGYDLEMKDSMGRTLLHNAVLSDNSYTVRALLHCGADIDAEDVGGRVPVQYCMSTEVVGDLCRHFVKLQTLNASPVSDRIKACYLPYIVSKKVQVDSHQDCLDELDRMKKFATSSVKWFWLFRILGMKAFEWLIVTKTSPDKNYPSLYDIISEKFDRTKLLLSCSSFKIPTSNCLDSLFPIYKDFLRLEIENIIAQKPMVNAEELFCHIGYPRVWSHQILKYLTEEDLSKLEKAILNRRSNFFQKFYRKCKKVLFRTSLCIWNLLFVPSKKIYVRTNRIHNRLFFWLVSIIDVFYILYLLAVFFPLLGVKPVDWKKFSSSNSEDTFWISNMWETGT